MDPTAPPAADLHVLGALALELDGAAPVARDRLDQAGTGPLADLVARDLAGFCAEAAELELGDAFERELIGRGMAGADTALAAQDAFGLQVEHARYLTVHDLAAMTALQYEHAGLAALWPLLETALLQPGGEAWLDQPPEPLLHYVDGEARIALFSPAAWRARYAADAACDSEQARARLQRQHQHFEARQRQIAAVLGAHGVPVNFVHCERDSDYRVELS